MAKTYSQVKVKKFLARLSLRRIHLSDQLEKNELETMRPYIEGELKAVDDFIQEVKQEFGLNNSDEQLQLEFENLKKAE